MNLFVLGDRNILSLRPEQEALLRFLWTNPDSDVLGVIGCAGGKTLVVILFAILLELYFPSKTLFILVLCPFKSVIVEWQNKCRRLKNKNFCYKLSNQAGENVVPSSCKLLLGSCDSLSFQSTREVFHIYGGNLLRYVVDEAHIIVEDRKTFRFRLNNVPQLKTFLRRPFLLLSGTYSKALEEESLGVYEFERLRCLRYSTARQNLKLCMVDVARQEDSLGNVLDLLSAFQEELDEDKERRAMVFVRTRKQAECWSEEAKAASRGFKTGKWKVGGDKGLIFSGFITGEFSVEEQESLLNAWKIGSFEVLFCTTCCAQCVDYAKVSVVVITFHADSIDQLQQMACRGGRNGQYSLVVLFRYKGELGKGTKEVYDGVGCLRYRIQAELDGPTLAARCERSDTKCAYCLEDESGIADEDSQSISLDNADNILELGI